MGLPAAYIEKASDVAILATKEKSLRLLEKGLDLKYRIYLNTPLDEVGSESSDLYSRLLGFRYGAVPTVQEVIDEQFQLALLQGVSLPGLRNRILAIREAENVEQLLEMFKALAEVLGVEVDEASDSAVRNIVGRNDIEKQFRPVDSDEIQVMTLHKSKGLEFKVVFHFDLEEWSFPHRRYIPGDWDNAQYSNLDQDTNLHYVGITRAESCCCLIRVSQRQSAQGNVSASLPSYFLNLSQLEGLYL